MSADVPLVSVITPSYNQGEFIEATVRSVLGQNYPKLEYIIVDGGSDDGTLEIIQYYAWLAPGVVRWVSEIDEGQADAVNKGFSMCRGDIVGWLNSDDVYFDSGTISYVVDVFRENPDADIVFGNDVLIDRKNRVIRVRRMPRFSYARLLRLAGGISQPAVFFRRHVVAFHHLRRDLRFCMDLEFWLRLGREYRFHKVDKILAGNRLHRDRKMIAHRHEALEEVLTVRAQYGRRERALSVFLLHLVDKLTGAFRRWAGLKDMVQLVREEPSVFVEVPDSKLWCLRNQVAGSAEKLVLNARVRS